MRNPNSLEEIAEIHSLLENIKKEYTDGIRGVLKKNDPELCNNIDTLKNQILYNKSNEI